MANPDQISLFDLSGANANAPSPEPSAPDRPADPAQIPTSPQIPIPPGTYGSLADLGEPCNRCQRCGLGTTRTHAVIGRGNPQAKIMIIGEAPGQQEDQQGLPFVGKAGQLLDKILASVQLDRDRDVYIGNAIKCRPPGNRNPPPRKLPPVVPICWNKFASLIPRLSC